MKRAADAALLAAITAGPLLFGTVERWSFVVVGALLLLAVFLQLLVAPAASWSPALAALSFVGVLALAQAAFSSPWDGPASLFPGALHGRASAQAPLRLALLGATVWLAHTQSAAPATRIRLPALIFLTAVFAALVGLVQMRYGNAALYGLRPVRVGHPFGPYYNSGNAAAFLTLGAFCGLGLLLGRSAPRDRSAGAAADFWAGQSLLFFGVAVVGVAIAVTRSRSAALACVAGLAVLAVLSLRQRMSRGRTAFAVGAALLVAAGFAFAVWRDPRWLGYYQFIGEKFDTSTYYRLSMWRSGAALAADFPVWGTGWGATRHLFPVYQERFIEAFVEYLHSDWLECLTAFGLAGFAAAALGLWRQLRRGAERARLEPDAAAVTAGLTAFLLHAALDFPFQIFGTAVVFCALLGWLGAGPASPLTVWGRRGALLAAALTAAALAVPPAAPSAEGECGPDAACLRARAARYMAAGRGGDAAEDLERAASLRFF